MQGDPMDNPRASPKLSPSVFRPQTAQFSRRFAMPGLLEGKKGLILNIANDRSIATHIANNAIKQGATCGFGFLPMDNLEKSQRRVKKAMEENGFAESWLHPCDVSSDESIEKFFAGAREQFGTIDFVVHSLAFANRDYLKKDEGNFLSTPR